MGFQFQNQTAITLYTRLLSLTLASVLSDFGKRIAMHMPLI